MNLIAAGRIFVGIGMTAFGVHQLVYGKFVRWTAPAPDLWAYPTGVVFLVCGIAILIHRRARMASLVLSAMILAMAVILYPFELAPHPTAIDVWGRAAKVFALSGTAALVAGSLTNERASGFLDWLIPIAPYFLAAFFCLAASNISCSPNS